ncbi:hypothetical protein [Changpingibacter yushuensis]|uniref:hypothetical protein n=1 Tax=Changpingibacter yushuensis TaxID=2758440 RepID=UPI0015F69AA5|nr:hypothetical protein [Changpingibacter yushuensis]
MITAIDYYLSSRSLNTEPITSFITNTTPPAQAQPPQEAHTPAALDTTINTQASWEDGLTIRTGWIHN